MSPVRSRTRRTYVGSSSEPLCKGASGDIRSRGAEPADFEGPVAVELHEAFKSGAALVELELKAPRGARCGELVVSVDRSGEKIEVKIEGARRRLSLLLMCGRLVLGFHGFHGRA